MHDENYLQMTDVNSGETFENYCLAQFLHEVTEDELPMLQLTTSGRSRYFDFTFGELMLSLVRFYNARLHNVDILFILLIYSGYVANRGCWEL